MKILALETATEACSVAVYNDGNVIERFEIAPRRHAELTLPWAEQLLAEAGLKKSQLDAIAVGRGPGAFTGVRLAIAIAQGIALALDKPVVPVSTLHALAFASLPPLRQQGRVGEGSNAVAQLPPGLPLPSQGEEKVLAAIDARMGEIYAATFKREGDALIATSSEVVIHPNDYALPEGGVLDESGWIGVGTGFAAENSALAEKFKARFASIDANALPHAADVARIAAAAFARGEAIAPELIEPAYLRNNVALTIEEQKALRASK